MIMSRFFYGAMSNNKQTNVKKEQRHMTQSFQPVYMVMMKRHLASYHNKKGQRRSRHTCEMQYAIKRRLYINK